MPASSNQQSDSVGIGAQFGTQGTATSPGTTAGGILDDIQAGSSNGNGNGRSTNNSPNSPPWSHLNGGQRRPN
ncbi:hypothetical protein N7493_011117 [Penicillium malachiteum]|uniref:Uncharacterized protein n=1 Tax=Penicillium malachiteum TaxID=1324776 RepID=A0AAD6HBM9_9EURO|nr:hypothetical protein N7493_011117 [Penicillium malachiteum]